MVYESDFYTTRRPYSRPLASSYTVTSSTIPPLSSVIQVRSYPHLPYVAHKRLVTFIHTPIHSAYHTGTPIPIRIHSRVRPSVLAAEYSRIRDLPRSSTRSYTERYLNSRDNIYFDDESREIRAKADALLRRIHVYVPRPSASDFHEDILPERFRSDDYIRRLLGARKNVAKEIETASWYTVPEQRNLGKGNLACVAYVAGKPHSRRRPYYKLADLRAADVKSDVNLLSYYSKNREAAANASPVHHTPLTEREIRKARANETEWSAAPPKKAASPEPEPEVYRQVVPEEPEEPEVPEAVPEPEPVVEKKKEKKEKKKEKDVKKMDEEGMKRAEEARLLRLEQEEEEHARLALIKEQEHAEQRAIELAAEKAKLAEIAEQERLEVERIIEEERLEEERVEAERIDLAERMEAEAEAAAAEERQAAQKAVEEERRKQEEEERLAAEVAAASDALATGSPLGEEAPEELEETQQEQEEKQIEPIVDEEALIDEVEVDAEEEAAAGGDETFVEEPVEVEGGGDSAPADELAIVEEDAPKIEEVNSSADADDIWGNKDE